METIIDKPKVPKGLSYVVKSSAVENAFGDLEADLNLHINFFTSKEGKTGRRIFECSYWLPNPNVPYRRFYIQIGTVPFEEKKIVNELISESVLPQFAEWAKFMHSMPDNSTLLKHNSYFRVEYNNKKLVIKCEPARI